MVAVQKKCHCPLDFNKVLWLLFFFYPVFGAIDSEVITDIEVLVFTDKDEEVANSHFSYLALVNLKKLIDK